MTPENISEAICLYMGWGFANSPSAYPERVNERFGVELGSQLTTAVKALRHEYWEAGFPEDATLNEATDRASEIFVASHPEISADGVKALAWNFAYNNR